MNRSGSPKLPLAPRPKPREGVKRKAGDKGRADAGGRRGDVRVNRQYGSGASAILRGKRAVLGHYGDNSGFISDIADGMCLPFPLQLPYAAEEGAARETEPLCSLLCRERAFAPLSHNA